MLDTSPRPRIVPVAYGKTDVGRQREHNEDQFLVAPDLGLFVVCDGMGGNNAGEVASALATTSLKNFFQATTSGPVPGKIRKEDESLSESERRLVLGVRKANSDVFEISSTRIEHQGMGSTIVAMHVSRDAATIEIAHIGDSRCYRIRNGTIQQLTRDHSLIGDALAWNPNLSEEELSRLPKNIISRALGLKRFVEVDVKTEQVEPGDVYMLCSDGLSGMVKDAQILELFLLSDDLQDACENLIALANEAGGSDNITAVAVRIEVDPRDADAPPSSDGPRSHDIEVEEDDPPSEQTRRFASASIVASAGAIADANPAEHLASGSPSPIGGLASLASGRISTVGGIRAGMSNHVNAAANSNHTTGSNGPDISASPIAVDELLSYLDGAPSDDVTSSEVRCAECGDVPTSGDLFCGNCGARIPP